MIAVGVDPAIGCEPDAGARIDGPDCRRAELTRVATVARARDRTAALVEGGGEAGSRGERGPRERGIVAGERQGAPQVRARPAPRERAGERVARLTAVPATGG